MVAAATIVVVGAILFGWLAFGGGAEKMRETAGLIVGHVLPPPPPSPDSSASQPAAIPVPVPPPVADVPPVPAPAVAGAAPAATRPAAPKVSSPAPGPATPSPPATESLTVTNVSSPVKPPESPATAPSAIVRFGKVKLAGEGSAPRETDVILQLEGTRIAVFDRDGRTLVRAIDYRKITGASYSQRQRDGFLGLGSGTRHWLRLEAGSESMLLRLDKGNQARIVEEFQRLSGRQVTGDRADTP